MSLILTLNCGSSSVKYALYTTDSWETLVSGIVQRVGTLDSFIHQTNGKIEYKKNITCADHKVAIQQVFELLVSLDAGPLRSLDMINAVGHRVVHGGEKFIESVDIDEEVETIIEKLAILAPLHNPPNLLGIRAAKEVLPAVPHVAVFDTAFHQSIPEHVYRYAIPEKWYKNSGIRRYGFHGTSHDYVAKRARDLLGKAVNEPKIITLHLGNGSSAAAVKNGYSVDTSMGLTPLEGLIMGTRSGDMDPGAVLYMMREGKLNLEETDRILNRESGFSGITGSISDMRDLTDAASKGDEKANLALRMAAYRIRKYIGAYTASLGGLDAIVFTAGIGENSPHFRKLVLENLTFFGIELDDDANSAAVGGKKETIISSSLSQVMIYVIPTNEELAMAQEVQKVISKSLSDI